MGNKDRNCFCGTTLFAGIPGHLTTAPTRRLPLTQAIRQRILRFPLSPCPRRPICCSAFRSDLSPRNSLWMRWQFYFRFVGFIWIYSI